MSWVSIASMDSPVGALSLSGDQELIALHIHDPDYDQLYQTLEPFGGGSPRGSSNLLRKAVKQLGEYFQGKRRVFEIPLRFHGTEFQCKVWEELRRIPYGKVITYGELARRLGNPKAARAVGGANGCNPIPIIVPCHRVIATGERLGGFGSGIDIKKRLLHLEGVDGLKE